MSCGFKFNPYQKYKSLYLGMVDLPPLFRNTLETTIHGVTVKVIDAQQYRIDPNVRYTAESLKLLQSAQVKHNDAGIDILFNTVNYLEFLVETTGNLNVIKGNTLISIYNFPSMDNAFFTGEVMMYGNGKDQFTPLVSADVVGHELSHGLVQSTGGLEYKGESGALNESYADCLGTAFEFWLYAKYNDDSNPFNDLRGIPDWAIGEDIAIRNKYLRNMENPLECNQPNFYQGQKWMLTESESDNGGVHTNSGVTNHLYYLVANQIGNVEAINLWFRVLKRLKNNSTMPEFATILKSCCPVEFSLTVDEQIKKVGL